MRGWVIDDLKQFSPTVYRGPNFRTDLKGVWTEPYKIWGEYQSSAVNKFALDFGYAVLFRNAGESYMTGTESVGQISDAFTTTPVKLWRNGRHI